MLPGEEGDMNKDEHGKDINSFSISKTMQKGAFEHETNMKGRKHC